jgi:PleD family two-component response regulator
VSFALIDVNLEPWYERDPVNAEHDLLHIVSAITSATRLTDLLARVDTHRLALVMPATSAETAEAVTSEIATGVSAVATSAAGGVASEWLAVAVIVLPPRSRCDAGTVFAEAEGLLGELRASGRSTGIRRLT